MTEGTPLRRWACSEQKASEPANVALQAVRPLFHIMLAAEPHLQPSQALGHVGVVSDAIKAAAAMRQAHDVKPAVVGGQNAV